MTVPAQAGHIAGKIALITGATYEQAARAREQRTELVSAGWFSRVHRFRRFGNRRGLRRVGRVNSVRGSGRIGRLELDVP